MRTSDFDDPKVVERWCGEQRAYVENYLRQQEVAHGPIAASPAWHLAPYLSVWTVESESPPGRLGWWVICGDVPADYVSAKFVKTPRDALRTFAARWKRLAASMREGQAHPQIHVASPDQRPELTKLLAARADLLTQFADDESVWQE